MKDFFVSYNHADLLWAQGIGDWLDQAGYSTILQSNDFVAGTNFVTEMHNALQTAKRLILVLSPNYLAAKFPEAEWTAAFATDPANAKPTLIPVRVRECSPPGLLKPLVYIDLVGLDVDAARAKFLSEIEAAIKKRRSKRTAANPPITPNQPPARPERSSVSQTATGCDITLIGGDQIIYQKPPVQKIMVTPRPGAISPSQRRQVHDWIDELVQSTIDMSQGAAFKMWWKRLTLRFGVEKYEELLADDLPEIKAWVKQQKAMNVRKWTKKAPEAFREERYKAIKATMRSMGLDNETYYPELARRLKMKPFSSLTQLTKVNLERVYNMVLRDARNR